MVEKRTYPKNPYNFRYLSSYNPYFCFKIITLIIPIIKESSSKRSAYGALRNYKDEQCITYLLNELEHTSDGVAIEGILKGLYNQSLGGNPQIQKKILAVYYSDIKLNESAKVNLMQLLLQFPNEESISVGVDILHKSEKFLAVAATNLLLSFGYPAGRIASVILSKLRSPNIKDVETAIFVMGELNGFVELLPDEDELLQIFVHTVAIKPNLNIYTSMYLILRNKYNKDSSTKIIQYLSDSNPNVIKGVLNLISSLIYKEDIESELLTSKSARLKYLEFLDHEDQNFFMISLIILREIGSEEGIKEYIPLLLAKVDFRTNSNNSLHLMGAINQILKKVEYNPIINDKYLKALELSDSRYRALSINGLKYSPDQQLKKSLSYLKDDPSEHVRRAYERSSLKNNDY